MATIASTSDISCLTALFQETADAHEAVDLHAGAFRGQPADVLERASSALAETMSALGEAALHSQPKSVSDAIVIAAQLYAKADLLAHGFSLEPREIAAMHAGAGALLSLLADMDDAHSADSSVGRIIACVQNSRNAPRADVH